MLIKELPTTDIPTLEHQLQKKRRGNLLVGRLQNWYDSVQRWKSTEAPDGYTETLLGHVRSMNHMVDSVAQSQSLSQEVNLPRLNLILGVHDLGEVGTGDIDRAKKAYEIDKNTHDSEEERYFLHVILPALPYVRPLVGKLMQVKPLTWLPTLEHAADNGYRAYESLSKINVVKNSNDREALLAKIMDRMDAVDKGVLHFHAGKEGAEREDAVLRQLAGANRASSLHLYRLFELLGEKGKRKAMEDLGSFMLDHRKIWDGYDVRIFDSPRNNQSLTQQLPSFAEVLGEISRRYRLQLHDSDGTPFFKEELSNENIGTFLRTATTVPQRL